MSLFSRAAMALRVLVEGAGALGDTIDHDEDLYRRITGNRRDLNPVAQDRAREVSLYLWRQNPMARRLVEMMVDFVVGDGITVGALDETVAEVLDEFWTDPHTRWDERHPEFVREQILSGELAFRVNEAEAGGRVRMGFIDPVRIADVRKDPEDALVDDILLLRPRDGGMQPEPVQLVRFDDVTDPGTPSYPGDAIYTAINRPLSAHRGTPDLLALADWVDGYDQILWNIVDRSAFQNAFVWDVTLDGADSAVVDAWVRDHGAAPKPGTIRAHNEKETWDAVSPDLGADQIEPVSRLVKNFILGGAGVPEGWFADGDSTNRATLSEQGDPTYRMLQRRQREVKGWLTLILDVVVDRAIRAGRLPKGVDRTVIVDIPEPSSKDIAKLSTALGQIATALMNAVAEKQISRESARKVFLSMVSMLGIELDPDEEADRIEEEQAQQAEEDAAQRQAEVAALTAMGLPGGPGATSPQNGPGGPQPPAAGPNPPGA